MILISFWARSWSIFIEFTLDFGKVVAQVASGEPIREVLVDQRREAVRHVCSVAGIGRGIPLIHFRGIQSGS